MTRKLSALTRVSSFAIAASLTAAAAAQSFLGNGSVTFGSANITEGAGTTDVDVFSSSAVIDWVPDDNAVGNFGAIAFQNSGTTATFRGFEGDYAVLNRINVADNSRKIFMNGTIQSFINTNVGGDIFFYSPSGFVIGSNAVINVGSLVLSASPISVDGNGGFINGGIVTFAQADPGAGITTVAGSQINALTAGSYVALVAPRVEHNGSIVVNGAAALVGAEAATINFRTDSLFDITVNMGTTDANGVVVGSTGSIGGPASTGAGDLHRAYLVAVPKNTAMTMLISSGADLGFEVAGAADVVGNAVVLSAGHDVAFGGIVGSPSFASGADAGISIENASFTSAVEGRANGDIIASSVGGSLSFASDVSLTGRDLAKLEAGGDGNVTVGGNLRLDASASGENEGDSAQAGNVTLQAFAGGQLSVTGDTVLTATGSGAFSSTPGVASGDGSGGTILVQATTGGDMFLGNADSLGSLDADSSGFGGSFFGDVDGGDGIGGTVNVFASGDGTLTVAGATYLRAEGRAGQPSDCFQCGGIGGTGDAGNINVQAHSGAASKIDLRDVLFVFADGQGGDGQAGGAGLGGNVVLSATGGGIVDVASDVSFAASGLGGNALGEAGNGGDGIGGGTGAGSVAAFADGGTLTIGGDFSVFSDGIGGQSLSGTGGTGTGGNGLLAAGATGTVTVSGIADMSASGTGGDGRIGGAGIGGSPTNGGGAFFNSGGGSLTINGLAILAATGQGGTGSGGAGGSATGGRTAVFANAGTVHFANNLFMDAGAIGGNGDTGGNAAALTSIQSELDPIALSLFALNGGSVDVDGVAVLAAEAVGGNGSNGNGGNAQGGEADVAAYVGDISIGTLALDVNGLGGNGGNGGNGGDGTGGFVDLSFGFEANPVGGTIALGSANITADGQGGDGGDGISAAVGGTGGTGGKGAGGRILFAGNAAGGSLVSGAAFLTTLGTGGAGGTGGSGSTGPGGTGGAGGNGEGGFIQTGTVSSEVVPTSGGGADYTLLFADSSGFGGAGGDGGTDEGGGASGGDGGDALGGSAGFLARGVLVTADAVSLTANATGGGGGLGSSQGTGGNARTGVIQVESKDRFGHPDQRGTLIANSIVGSAIAVAGSGSVDGVSSVIGNSYFRVLNGDATIGSVDITTSGSVFDNTFVNSTVSVRDGTAAIGDFSFTTTGELALDASNGSMTANMINLAANTFVADSFSGAQAGPGTYSAGSFSINTAGNFLTNAHLVSGGSLSIVAPGAINMRNATSSDGDLTLQAGSSILAGILDAAGFVSVLAPGNITLGNVTAGDYINVESSGGAILTGNLTGATIVELDAAGNIGFGNVVADAFDFSAGGNVDGGDILAATQASGEAEGAVDLGNISVGIQMAGGASEDGFAVGFSSATSINVLDVEADESIGFATFGPLTTGDLNAGGNIMTLASGNISVGAMTTTGELGQIYVADSSMFTAAGGPDNFDPLQVLNAPPVATAGSITINGPVSTSLFRAAAGTSFTAGNINADFIFAEAGGTATLNGLWSAPDVELWSNDIDIDVEGGIDAGPGGSIRLVSTNGTQALIGDGLSGSGYRLGNSEFARLSSGSVEILARGDASAPIDMLIGDLSITGPLAGSTIDDPTGHVAFATGDLQTQTASGVIRITGDVAATGFQSGNSLEFYAGRFELDAATGSISITSSGGALSGELGLYADQIHVAEGSILDQLAADPQYDGYQDDLNAPASVQRPEGVLNAATIWIESDNLQNVLIQNMGTAETPAGFLAQETFINDDFEVAGPPGSIDLIVNGQLQTEGGVLSGIAVRDASVEGADLTPFTANSTVNGCLLVGACAQTPDNPFPPDFTPTPGIQQEIVLLGDDPMPPPTFGNEDVIDDNDEETEDSSPIVPPQPLFDTSELGEAEGTGNPAFNTTMRSNPANVQEGDIDDPVSGGGNPALMEAGGSNDPGDGSPPPAPPSGSKEKQP